jgi:ATP-dependent DNA ligase
MDQTQAHPLVEFLVEVAVEHKIHKELQEEAAHQGDLGAAEMHLIHQTQLEMELQTREVAEEQDVILTHHKVETTLLLVVTEVLDMF